MNILMYYCKLFSLYAVIYCFFFFNDTATTEIYTLSLHDALPILAVDLDVPDVPGAPVGPAVHLAVQVDPAADTRADRSEEHTSELLSQSNLVCRLLLEKKKQYHIHSQRFKPTATWHSAYSAFRPA